MARRPDFEAYKQERFAWLGGDWLTDSEAKDLQRLLPKSMKSEQQAVFMAGVNRALVVCEWLQRSTPERVQKKKLEAVAEQARALLKTMAGDKLDRDTRGAIRAARLDFAVALPGTAPMSPVSVAAARGDEILPHFWDTVQDIELMFTHTATLLAPSRQKKPKSNNAKALAVDLAKAHFQAVGEWPSFSDSKNVWFPGFVDALPKRLGVAPVADTIRAAIQELKNGV